MAAMVDWYDTTITERDTATVPRSPAPAITEYPDGTVAVDVPDATALPPWFIPTLGRLGELMQLPDRPVILAAATTAVEILVDLIDPNTAPPSLVALDDGGLQVEWHQTGLDVEILIPHRGPAELFVASDDDPAGWEGPLVFGLVACRDLADQLSVPAAVSTV